MHERIAFEDGLSSKRPYKTNFKQAHHFLRPRPRHPKSWIDKIAGKVISRAKTGLRS